MLATKVLRESLTLEVHAVHMSEWSGSSDLSESFSTNTFHIVEFLTAAFHYPTLPPTAGLSHPPVSIPWGGLTELSASGDALFPESRVARRTVAPSANDFGPLRDRVSEVPPRVPAVSSLTSEPAHVRTDMAMQKHACVHAHALPHRQATLHKHHMDASKAPPIRTCPKQLAQVHNVLRLVSYVEVVMNRIDEQYQSTFTEKHIYTTIKGAYVAQHKRQDRQADRHNHTHTHHRNRHYKT